MASMTHDPSQFDDLPPLMSPKTLASFLDVSPKTLERWRKPPNWGPEFVQPTGSSLIRFTGYNGQRL